MSINQYNEIFLIKMISQTSADRKESYVPVVDYYANNLRQLSDREKKDVILLLHNIENELKEMWDNGN
ncbi:MAG: hypothetical protein MJ250_02790 [Alphaproteobacteria bacterium]|nr:hypothetical protein [Alphaproteobacteria bacterium]